MGVLIITTFKKSSSPASKHSAGNELVQRHCKSRKSQLYDEHSGLHHVPCLRLMGQPKNCSFPIQAIIERS